MLQEISTPILANKWTRFTAALIDYFAFIAFYVIIGISFGETYSSTDGVVGFHIEGFPAFICFLYWFLMLPIMEGLCGQTLGKLFLKIKVVKCDFSKSSMSKSIIRHLFDFVDYLPFLGIIGMIVASNNNLRQRVGDLVARTIVVVKN